MNPKIEIWGLCVVTHNESKVMTRSFRKSSAKCIMFLMTTYNIKLQFGSEGQHVNRP